MNHRYFEFLRVRSRRDLILIALGAVLVMPMLWAVEGLLAHSARLLGWTQWLQDLSIEMMQVWRTIVKGGIVMLVIVACSIRMVVLALRQWLTLRANENQLQYYLGEIRVDLPLNTEVLERKSQANGLLSSVVRQLIEFKSIHEYATLVDLLDRTINEVCLGFDQQTDRIKFLASAAPRLGLLATVLGMVIAFQAISDASTSSERSVLISDGLAMALGPTIVGIILGLVGDKCAQYFEISIAGKRNSIQQALRPVLVAWCSQSEDIRPRLNGKAKHSTFNGGS